MINTKDTSNEDNTEMQEPINKKINIYFLLSIILFSFTVIISAYFYISNRSLQNKIEETANKIAVYDEQVKKLKSNKLIIAYDVVTSAKDEVNKNIVNSEAQNYINEFIRISKKYKIDFYGFSYASQKISALAVSEFTNGEDPIAKISNFIKDYRSGVPTLFTLGPIQYISGDVLKRSFQVAFEVVTK